MKKKLCAVILAVLAVGFCAAVMIFDWDTVNSYRMYNTQTRQYLKATVKRIVSESLETDEADNKLWLGEQKIEVEITEGENRGSIVEINNYLTQIHSIKVSQGQHILICADMPENATPYYTVYQYDRSIPLILLIALFALTVLFVGRKKGLMALLGLTFCILTVVVFMVQALFHGFSPIGVTLLTVLICTCAGLLLLNGLSKRTLVAVVSTLAGVLVTGMIFAIFSNALHISGYNTEEAETLLLVGYSTGLSIRHLLFAGIMISALGAVMDVAVSLTASLDELVTVKPDISRKELIRSGLNIGKDMIGTMSNTLIFAFAGTSLNTMICLLAYGYQHTQLFSSDYLTIELVQGLCATSGVVLTVPITTAIGTLILLKPIVSGSVKRKYR